MPTLDQLGQAGGWAAFALLAITLLLAFIRGDVVAGPVYRSEVARGDKLADQADQSIRALGDSTRATLRIARRIHQLESVLAVAGIRLPDPPGNEDDLAD